MENNSEYLGRILELLTEKQRDCFNRMYPKGPTKKQLSWAITQVENTLKNLNTTTEELRITKKEHREQVELLNKELSQYNKTTAKLHSELENSKRMIEQLNSNTDLAITSEIQERLNLLDALEKGGVDNWDGYDYAIESFTSPSTSE